MLPVQTSTFYSTGCYNYAFPKSKSSYFNKGEGEEVHCFSMQVVTIKCFFLNPEKKIAQICAVVFEKNAKTAQLRHTPIPKNDATESKATRQG